MDEATNPRGPDGSLTLEALGGHGTRGLVHYGKRIPIRGRPEALSLGELV